MSKKLSREKCKESDKSQLKWNQAITDAKAMLEEAETQVRRLRSALRTLKESKEAGESWPGSESNTVAEQQ